MAVSAPETINGTAKVARNGRVRLCQANLTDSERHCAVAMHLVFLILSVGAFWAWPATMVPSWVIWLARKRDSAFNDDHGREVTNFMISFSMWHIVTLITVVCVVLWPVLWIVGGVNAIRGPAGLVRTTR